MRHQEAHVSIRGDHRMRSAVGGAWMRPDWQRMVRIGLVLGSLVPVCCLPTWAQESTLEFVEGLRERGYFDTALEYLDDLGRQSNVPESVRERLDLERGLTLQQLGSAARVPEDREQYLSRAEESYRRFISAFPDHPQAALANSSLGELLFERARTLVWQAESPSSADRRPELQQQARLLIDDAQAIYQKAHDQYLSQYKAFPNFIDQTRDPEPFQQRLDAEARYLRAWFNLSRCTYERGQTYDKGSAERGQILGQAAELFEKIHTSRRTNAIGLNARLMMGKCFQEQGDLGRALGIYNEMLAHKSENAGVQTLRSVALHYRLICLNDPQKHDYQLVLQEASEWLQQNRALSATAAGVGILWEKAVAEEKLAEDRGLEARQKDVLLRQAIADSQQVARFPGAFREPANAMNRRLKAAVGDKDREPRDFDTAFERARGMIDQIQKLKDETEAAASEAERQQKRTALDLHLNEVGRLLQLALDLRADDTDGKAVAQARYLLSFIFFRQRKNFDAVIMSTYCMERDRTADPDTALNATEIAISAAVQAWNDAPAQDREFETSLLRDVCVQVLELYPQSTRGNEARMRLGRVYQQLQNPLEAAKWFLQVPETDPEYASARISAGQAFWAAWTMQMAANADADPAERRSADDLQNSRNEARKLLLQGIQISRDRLGPEVPPSDEVIAAEVSLASILNLEGDFQQAIQRLTAGGDNSVLSAIVVPDPASRPQTGVLSSAFAGLTYRLLLRAYVGTQQIDQALETMAQLEKVGGQDVTAVYTQLGMELQDELKRLNQAGETQRLAEVRSSFEQFLQKVYEQRDPGNYNSLLWIGETYYGLGQGVSDDAAAASAYYDKAATSYQAILDGKLAQEPAVTAIRLRLARCRRQQKQFEQALQIAQEILTANPLALDAQFEAAWILSDWGSNGEPSKLLDAIQGLKSDKGAQVVWGWASIAKRLQQTLRRDATPEMRDRLLDARYELSNSRRRYAATGAPEAKTQLSSALAEITIFVQVFRDIDPTWWAKFDRLYQDLQADLGQTRKPLERPVLAAAVAAPPPKEERPPVTASEASAVEAAAAAAPVETPSGGIGWLAMLAILGLAAAAAAGFYFLLSRPPQRRHSKGTMSQVMPAFGELDFAAVATEQPAVPTGRKPLAKVPTAGVTTPLKTGAAAAPAKAVTEPAKPAAASPASGGGAAARPVRRPPTEAASTAASTDVRRKPAAPGAPGTSPAAPGAGATGAAASGPPPSGTTGAPGTPAVPPRPRPRPAPTQPPAGESAGTAPAARPSSAPRPVPRKPADGTNPAAGGSPMVKPEGTERKTRPAPPEGPPPA